MLSAFLWGGQAASSLLIGYVVAGRPISERNVGLVMGLGAGALIGAIAYELVPESALAGPLTAVVFLLGALAFFIGDWIVDRRGGAERTDITAATSGSGAAIFVGTLLDNIPESIVLGMSLGLGGAINVAFLVAVFISNLPEGVAGTLNLAAAGVPRPRVLAMWIVLVLVSAACAALGYAAVGALSAADGRLAQAFAAGAMLTMLADAMMPEAFEHGGKVVGLATVLGFMLAALL